MKLHNLSDIHTRRDTQWIQHDIDWCTVWQVRHILYRNDIWNDTLVTVTSGHLIPNVDFTFLWDEDTNQLVHTWWQLVSIFTCKDTHIVDDTATSVWYTEWCITNFTRFFTKDSTKKTFFRCWISFTFWCDFTNEQVSIFNLSTNTDDTVFVQVFEGFITNIWNFACNFFRAKLCIACFWFILFDSNRCINVIFNQTFRHDDGILEVITFPSHISNEWVLTKRHFPIFHWWAITNDVACFNFITKFRKWTLVIWSSWVWTAVFHDVIDIKLTWCTTYTNFVSIYIFNSTVMFSDHSSTWVTCCLMFHTCTNPRCMWINQWNGLTLHVGTHKGTVGVIVFQERNTSGCYGDNLFRWNVHIVRSWSINFNIVTHVTGHYSVVDKFVVISQWWVSLGNCIVVLFVSC